MKLTKVITIIICFSAIVWSLDAPTPLYDMNGQLRKSGLMETIQDIYVRLGTIVDNFSNQSIGGNKTFTGTNTFTQGINTQGKHWELIRSSRCYVDGNTAMIFSGLDGNTDEEYEIKIYANFVGGKTWGITCNDDTANNYAYSYWGISGAASDTGHGNNSTSCYLGYSDSRFICTIFLRAMAVNSFYRAYTSNGGDGYSYSASCTGLWCNSTDNIVKLTILGGFSSGSIVEIWSKR